MNTTDSNTVSYKCTNCGAPVNYRPGVLSAHCTYCNTTIAIKQEKKEEKKSSKKKEEEVFDLREGTIIHCKTCSAEYLKDEHINSEKCIFCDASISEEDIYDGFYVAPSHYLPFPENSEHLKVKVEVFLKRLKYPSPFKSPTKYSKFRISRLYVPCWTDDINIYTADSDLNSPYFNYRNLFIIASEYLNSYSDKLLPWNRNQLLPVDKDVFRNEKVVLCAFKSKLSGSSQFSVLDRRNAQFGKYSSYPESRKEKIKKIKRATLVLLPLYAFYFSYKNKEYSIFQNAYEGELAYEGPFGLNRSNKSGEIFGFVFVLLIILLIILAAVYT